ncbi:uncharacterized protein LOC129940172 [Eupeodes corollae]|uniref:uncharacterized protein LOC129940172 n=1 Tax=Eupeodes corollae TaxID=290404 RepID=UPI0024901593|nr:uncharacterized protein LOC129940172 [Eupeodes corollae]
MSSTKLSLTVVQDLCERYSNQKIDYNGVELLSYSLKKSNDAPAGYLGRHEVLSVIIQKKPSEAPQELIFFIKTAPIDIASRQKYIEEFGVFKKEVSVYANLLPKLSKGQLDFSARCYYAKDDILVFEHLGEMGFRMGSDRSGLLDFDHLKCALSSLANMHASSIVFEAKNQLKICDMFPEIVKENAYPAAAHSIRRENFDNGVVALCEIIKIMPEFKASKHLDFILKQFPREMNKIFDFVKPSSKYLNVFSHGDLWANNLLFKYENNRPVQSRIVDFQLTRYAPPILDVITVLTIPTSRKFRSEHLDSLLASYYSMLGYFLKQHGFQINDFLTPQQFEESIREFKEHGLIESCLFSHLTILPTELTESVVSDEGFEDFFKNKRNEICLKAFNTDEVYRSRLSDMISDIVNNYILN